MEKPSCFIKLQGMDDECACARTCVPVRKDDVCQFRRMVAAPTEGRLKYTSNPTTVETRRRMNLSR